MCVFIPLYLDLSVAGWKTPDKKRRKASVKMRRCIDVWHHYYHCCDPPRRNKEKYIWRSGQKKEKKKQVNQGGSEDTGEISDKNSSTSQIEGLTFLKKKKETSSGRSFNGS